jgi:putative transposase
MKKSRFTDEQIIGFLKQVETGAAVKELGRKHGFSDASFYKWRSRFGGMDVADARRLRELEGENGKLKKLLAESLLAVVVNVSLALLLFTVNTVWSPPLVAECLDWVILLGCSALHLFIWPRFRRGVQVLISVASLLLIPLGMWLVIVGVFKGP